MPDIEGREMLLVGDVGATKTSFTLFADLEHDYPILSQATLKSNEFPSFQQMLDQFLALHPAQIEVAAFGVPGPVIDGQVTTTNIPWSIRERDLAATLKTENAWLLNDLEAIASGVPTLSSDDVHTLQVGEPSSNGPRVVIAPGTGLGEAFLTYHSGIYQAHPTEGGHADFAPTSKLQIDLLKFLLETYEHVSYERLCSGIGLPNIYRFLKEGKHMNEPSWLANELRKDQDPTPIIVNAALAEERTCDLCRMTVELFVEILGAECGNLALKFMATGGIYVGGGMVPKMLPGIDTAHFLRSFANKGRFSEFMGRFPIHVIMNPDVGMMGARQFALQKLSAV
jgi:glucokinase